MVGRQLASGHAQLEVEVVFHESTVTSACAASPMKLLTPRARGPSVWAYTSSFGGGLVAGDQTRLDLRLGAAARCFTGTQASTKIYRNPGKLPCGHVTRATLEADSLLVFAPDPVQAFADSTYVQSQEFHLEQGAGLALVDWFSSGRAARGERWTFSRLQSRNDVFVSGNPVLVDSVALDEHGGPLDSQHRTGRFNCFATLVFIGEPLRAAAGRMLGEISARPVEPRAPLVCSASAVRSGAVLRVAGEQVEAVSLELRHHLEPLRDLLGDDPWERKR